MLKLDQKGQGLTEYLILLMLVALVSVGATQVLGRTVKRKITQAKDQINREISIYNDDGQN